MCGYVCDHCGKCQDPKAGGAKIPCFSCGYMNTPGTIVCGGCGEPLMAPPGPPRHK